MYSSRLYFHFYFMFDPLVAESVFARLGWNLTLYILFRKGKFCPASIFAALPCAVENNRIKMQHNWLMVYASE